ncbi:MAG TPA: putative zinc-binding peptidase [Verrucomicrobiae bacterium]|jgi:hypothetical protein
MKVYYCGGCGSLVFFENVKCLNCGRALGFDPSRAEVIAVESTEKGALKRISSSGKEQLYRQCENARKYEVCNWLVPIEDPNPLCKSCRLNAVIPDLNIPGNRDRWRRIEAAKHRVVYTLVKFILPTEGSGNASGPLRFRFLGDVQGEPPVKTGHENGVITLNIAEADDADREQRRVSLHEPYRTLVGHFRHEVGHYYWDRLVAGSAKLDSWRKLFGDETRPYDLALQTYYRQGPLTNWPANYISAYASAHPWEDWAETWAHYLHIIDTLETAGSYGVMLKPKHPSAKSMTTDPSEVCGVGATFDTMMAQWFPLVYALNSLNRGMGLHDLYPFALSNGVIAKLQFVHDLLQTNQCSPAPSAT